MADDEPESKDDELPESDSAEDAEELRVGDTLEMALIDSILDKVPEVESLTD